MILNKQKQRAPYQSKMIGRSLCIVMILFYGFADNAENF